MKTISLKLKSSGSVIGPFDIKDDLGNILGENITKEEVISGVSYVVSSSVKTVSINSKSGCVRSIVFPVNQTLTEQEFKRVTHQKVQSACVWRHLTNPTLLNSFYGSIYPYIIEYPFSYDYQDQILQNVKDYTKAYIYYTDEEGTFDVNNKIEVDNEWFNKAVLYSSQQSTGILNLVPKPVNKMKDYMSYPIFNTDSKTILYTKSDSFYQYNTFWDLVKDKSKPLFITSCSSLSIDKEVNQSNMEYGQKNFSKSPLRAKDLRIRHISDDKSHVLLISQFIITSSQVSY